MAYSRKADKIRAMKIFKRHEAIALKVGDQESAKRNKRKRELLERGL